MLPQARPGKVWNGHSPRTVTVAPIAWVAPARGVGDLRIEELLDASCRRYVRTACLRADEGYAIARNLLPDLHDVHIVSMSPQAFSLTGIERVDSVEFAQSWIVTVTRG